MPGMRYKHLFIPAAGLALLIGQSLAQSTDKKPAKKDAAKSSETLAKPLTPRQQKAKEQALKKELLTPYKNWMDNDVVYIISDEERKAFKQFNTDEEREQFVEQFWLRRDPTPDTQ